MKKIFYLSLFVLLFNYGCGFTPTYKGFYGIDFILNLDTISGDRDLNNSINSQITRYKKGNEEYQIIILKIYSNVENISIA